MEDVHGRICCNREFRKLNGDSDFEVILDFNGRFFRAIIGDRANGFRTPRRTRTLEEAIEWLQLQAREFYPQSTYVQSLLRPGIVLPFKVTRIPPRPQQVPSLEPWERKLG
jgi:hypothetical protein